MKFTQALDKVLGQKSKVKVLRHLITTRAELNGRQIASDLGMSPWVCHKTLNELCSQGILLMRNVGRTHLFRLNQESYLVRNLLSPLFKKESALLKTASREIIKEFNISVVSVILFGSVAKKKEKPYSDIDLMVLIPKSNDKKRAEKFFENKNEYFISKFGNVLSPYILTMAEFKRRYRRGNKLIREILLTGESIYGKSISEIIK